MSTLSQSTPNRIARLACLVGLVVVMSATAANARPPRDARDPGTVDIHRKLSKTLSDLGALEQLLDELPTTRKQRRQIRRILDDIRRRTTRLITDTPARIPRQGIVVVEPTEPPPVDNGPVAMTDAEFAALDRSVKKQSFAKGKIDVIRTAAPHHLFTVAQVTVLLKRFSFASKRLTVVEILAPQIIDRKNAFQLYDSFTYESDKRKLRAILEK